MLKMLLKCTEAWMSESVVLTLLYTCTLLHTLQHYTMWWSFLSLLLFVSYCFCVQDDTVLSCNGTENISCTLLLTLWGYNSTHCDDNLWCSCYRLLTAFVCKLTQYSPTMGQKTSSVLYYLPSKDTTLHNVMIIFVAVRFLLLLYARWHSTVCNESKTISCTLLPTPWGFLVDCAQGQGHPLHTPTWSPKSVWRASCCCWQWSGLCRNLAMDKSSPALEHLGPRWRWLGEYRPGHEGTWSVDSHIAKLGQIWQQDDMPRTGFKIRDKVQTMLVNDQTTTKFRQCQ